MSQDQAPLRFYQRRCVEDAGLVVPRWPRSFRARAPWVALAQQRWLALAGRRIARIGPSD